VTWLDDRIRKKEAHESREFDITNDAPRVYEFLWAEIKKNADEACKKGVNLSTNGSPNERTVAFSDGPIGISTHPSFRNEYKTKRLTIALAADRHSITAQGEGVSFTFVLDKRNDAVCRMPYT
jgi:hypothetical protein